MCTLPDGAGDLLDLAVTLAVAAPDYTAVGDEIDNVCRYHRGNGHKGDQGWDTASAITLKGNVDVDRMNNLKGGRWDEQDHTKNNHQRSRSQMTSTALATATIGKV